MQSSLDSNKTTVIFLEVLLTSAPRNPALPLGLCIPYPPLCTGQASCPFTFKQHLPLPNTGQGSGASRKPVLGVPGPSKAAWHSLVLWSQPLFIQAKPGSWHSAMLRTSFQGVARLVRHKALYRSPCLLPRVHLASAFGSSTESLVSSQAAR